MSKRVYLDMDGVLVDIVTAIKECLGEPPAPWPKGQYRAYTLYGMTFEAFWNELGPLDRFFAKLPWMDDGRAIVSAALDAVGAENVCLLSSPLAGSACLAGKQYWIARELGRQGGVDWLSRLVMALDKRWCAYPGAVLVDDSDENVRLFREAGGSAILVPRHWNSGEGDAVEAVRKGLNGSGKGAAR